MAIIDFKNGKAWSRNGSYTGYHTLGSVRRVIDYIKNPEKTRPDLIKGFNCSPEHAYEEFVLNKVLWDKDKEDGSNRMLMHFVQSFDVEDAVTPEMASEIASKLLQHNMFHGFQAIYVTHTDRRHIHTHFVVDTVNKETGKKWEMSNKELQELKDYSDTLCREYELSVCQKREQPSPYKRRSEVEVQNRQMSWKEEIRIAAEQCSKISFSRIDYYHKLKEIGITMNWTDDRKYIVFIDKDGHRVRNSRLEPQALFTKEGLEKQFELNRQIRQIEWQNAEELNHNIHGTLALMKTLIQSGERYPLQRTGLENRQIGSQAALENYRAEQQKGRGYEP